MSSASHQRTPLTGVGAQPGTSRLTRHRKVSRSAGPSPAALRKALKISGGEYTMNYFRPLVLQKTYRFSYTSQMQACRNPIMIIKKQHSLRALR